MHNLGHSRCLFNAGMLFAGLCFWLAYGLYSGSPAFAGSKPRYHDIYLTENRVCKACVGRWLDNRTLELSNRLGERTIVPPEAIIGVDAHPLARRIFRKSLHDTGLAAKVIVPYAFDDWDEFVCKYCNEYDNQGSGD